MLFHERDTVIGYLEEVEREESRASAQVLSPSLIWMLHSTDKTVIDRSINENFVQCVNRKGRGEVNKISIQFFLSIYQIPLEIISKYLSYLPLLQF